MKKTVKRILKTVEWIEIILAIFIIIAVIISSIDLVRLLFYTFKASDPSKSYDFFQALLSHALILVIGLELAVMLIRHTPGSVIEVMLFAIARKMLIYSSQTYEIAIGVAALAGLFAIRKYLFVHKIEHPEELIVDGKTPVKTANTLLGLQIPENLASSLGELVIKLGAEGKIQAGDVFRISNAKLEVLVLNNDNPEKIKVTESTDN